MTVAQRGASVVAKLLNLQKTTGLTHQYFIDRFAQERFLYRLSTGVHRERFVLKGGLLLTAVAGHFYRATRDIDTRVFADNDPDVIHAIVIEAMAHEVEDDGMTFDLESVRIETIIAQRGEEHGLRLAMRALIGDKVRALIQLDMGFNDRIFLPHEAFEYPVLLPEFKPPILRSYSIESAIAEKLEAIAVLDQLTSRYKDFDDILVYAATRRMHVAPLAQAVAMTFETRGTSIERLLPALGADRAIPERERAYQSYRRSLVVNSEPTTFIVQLERLRDFVRPLLRFSEDGIARVWENGTWTPI